MVSGRWAVKEVEINLIDAECEDFRISEELDSPCLTDSLRAVGQLNPVILLERGARPVVVCGFRRLASLRRLGERAVMARILNVEDCLSVHPLELALRDNLAQRKLSPLEQARAAVKLRDICGVSRQRLIVEYLPLLGLPPHESTLAAYLALQAAQPELRRLFAADALTLDSIGRLAKLPENEQKRFAALMAVVRLSASLQKKTLDLLEDLAGINRAPFTSPLDLPEILEFLRDVKLSSFQKGEKLCRALYRLRNPRLTNAEADFAAQGKRLELPGAIRVIQPPYFETAAIRFEFEAESPEKFRELAAALQKAARSTELDELFSLI